MAEHVTREQFEAAAERVASALKWVDVTKQPGERSFAERMAQNSIDFQLVVAVARAAFAPAEKPPAAPGQPEEVDSSEIPPELLAAAGAMFGGPPQMIPAPAANGSGPEPEQPAES